MVFLVVGIVVAGLTGIMFWLWPTTVGDAPLRITPQTIVQLESLRAESKFHPDLDRFYPGPVDEPTRAAAQFQIDTMISALVVDLPRNPRKAEVLGLFKTSLPAFEHLDSEDRDEVLVYLNRVMAITGVDSSGELLNVWRYGFPYGWLKRT